MITLTLILFGLTTFGKFYHLLKEIKEKDYTGIIASLLVIALYLRTYIWLINHFIN